MSEHVCFCLQNKETICPTESPTANQTGWTGTGPPAPLSRVAYRTEPQRRTSPQSATPSETSDLPLYETERRDRANESQQAIHGH